MIISEILAGFFICVGVFFAVVGCVGLHRFPDFYTRIHAAGMNDTMGAFGILVGLMFASGVSFVSVKLLMILFFMWVTGTTAVHALAKAAHSEGLQPWTGKQEGVSSKG